MSFIVLTLLLTAVLTTQAVRKDQFFAFGTNNGDQTVPEGDDNYVGPISLNYAVKYFGSSHSQMFVSTNGVMSFDYGVSQYIPDEFPLKGALFLAAFWADVDTRGKESGKVFYRESTSRNDLALGTRIVKEVFSRNKIGEFKATSVLVATWDHVGYFNGKSDRTNTFQVAVVSGSQDGQTFAIFNYLSGDYGMQWTYGDASSNKPAHAGFNKGDGEESFSMPGSHTENIVNIGEATNIGVPGRFVFKIDGPILPPEQIAPGGNLNANISVIKSAPFNMYDVTFNPNGQLIEDMLQEGGLDVYANITLVGKLSPKKGGKVCAVGPFKSGKTFLLKRLCGKSIPDGFLMKTRGISIAFHENEQLACVDTEGEHRVDTFRRGKLRKATDRFQQEVAISICDLVIIVIDGLTSHSRDYVDSLLKQVVSLSERLQTKQVVIVHNFKHFEDPKIVGAYIRDTILLAYQDEEVTVEGAETKSDAEQSSGLDAFGIEDSETPSSDSDSKNARDRFDDSEWAYFQHSWCSDHKPTNKSQAEKLTVTHLVLAKNGSKAGEIWNEKSFKQLEAVLENVKLSGSGLHVVKDVQTAFSRILPNYFLAYKGEASQGDSKWNLWFACQSVVTATAKMITRLIHPDHQDPKENPFAIKFTVQPEKNDMLSLTLANRNDTNYTAFELTNDGTPLGGYQIACRSAEKPTSLLIQCDVPGMIGVGDVGEELSSGKIIVEELPNKNTVVIKGIRAEVPEMKKQLFSSVSRPYDGPFRHDFEVPEGYSVRVLDAPHRAGYIKYANGVLQVELPSHGTCPSKSK